MPDVNFDSTERPAARHQPVIELLAQFRLDERCRVLRRIPGRRRSSTINRRPSNTPPDGRIAELTHTATPGNGDAQRPDGGWRPICAGHPAEHDRVDDVAAERDCGRTRDLECRHQQQIEQPDSAPPATTVATADSRRSPREDQCLRIDHAVGEWHGAGRDHGYYRHEAVAVIARRAPDQEDHGRRVCDRDCEPGAQDVQAVSACAENAAARRRRP